MNKEIRESFGDVDQLAPKTMKGVKLVSKSSQEPNQQERLEEAAKEYDGKEAQYLQRAFELGTSFIGHLKNKTLPDEKGPSEKQAEQKCVTEWKSFIDLLNNDNSQKEGAGSSSAQLLTFSCLLKLRDRINVMDYEKAQLEIENLKLKSKLSEIEAQLKSVVTQISNLSSTPTK